ncbi:hypothetical protein RRG08_035368 [Elysia crispata]|uniref:Uncharacterized protein n=1 Tax=Elysia crispata TaxID=231223 RepID=A0AAE0Y3M3_9GAST|nr:hypothetical protein RRG08_035368 [Elysia crispata]
MLVKQKVLSEVHNANVYNLTRNFGWRGFANLSPTDAVFEALTERGAMFDSSVMTDSRDQPWPYTLDFGLKDHCSIHATHCPTARYPGLCGNRSPFGINLHHNWLMGQNRIAYQRGLIRFFDEVLGRGDVVIVSIEQMLKWVASPVPYASQFPC